VKRVRPAVACVQFHFRGLCSPAGFSRTRRLVLLGAAASVLLLPPTAAMAFSVRAALDAGPLDSPPPPTVLSVTPAEGTAAGATKVTIVGEDLKGVTTVNFGATAVALKAPSKSQTKIKVLSPSGTGTVAVTVSSPEGSSEAGPGDEFTYVPSPPVLTSLSVTHGRAAGGRPITIKGQSFGGATAVHFGTTSVPFTVKGTKSIKTTTPPASALGTVDVTVTTPEGTSELSAAAGYTFEPELPDVESSNPFEGPAIGGNTVTLHGMGFLETSEVTFDDASAVSFEVINDTEIEAVPAAHTTARVPITATTPQGTSPSYCYSGKCPAIAMYKFERPTVSSVAPSSGPLEGGTSITVTGSGFATGDTGATLIRIGGRETTSVDCSSTTICTAVTPTGASAKTLPLVVKVPSNLNAKETQSEETEAADFTYE
jgi:hypothetical protein